MANTKIIVVLPKHSVSDDNTSKFIADCKQVNIDAVVLAFNPQSLPPAITIIPDEYDE